MFAHLATLIVLLVLPRLIHAHLVLQVKFFEKISLVQVSVECLIRHQLRVYVKLAIRRVQHVVGV